MKRVVWRAVSASASARTRCRSASLRASQAAPASVEVIAMPASEAVTSSIMRRWRRCASRCFSSSSGMSSRPAMSFSLASLRPSLPARASAAIGSERSSESWPSGPMRKISAFGKHSSAAVSGRAEAPGSPAMIRQKTRSSRPSRLKVRISSLTQRDRAAVGEQITICAADCCSASVSLSPRLVAEASSSRSRNTGARRSGMGPNAVSRPTRWRGIR